MSAQDVLLAATIGIVVIGLLYVGIRWLVATFAEAEPEETPEQDEYYQEPW